MKYKPLGALLVQVFQNTVSIIRCESEYSIPVSFTKKKASSQLHILNK